jgi:predicted DNA-binding protein (UPF0251 family)
MNWYKIYQEVQNEIMFLGFRIDDLEKEYGFWYSRCFSGGRTPIAPLDVCLRRMNKICEDTIEYVTLLEMKENTKKQMDKQLEGLDEYEYEVIRLNVFEGMKLAEVAKKMYKSEIWAKKVSSRARKKLAI